MAMKMWKGKFKSQILCKYEDIKYNRKLPKQNRIECYINKTEKNIAQIKQNRMLHK